MKKAGAEIKIMSTDIADIREQFTNNSEQLMYDVIRKGAQKNIEKIIFAFPPINDKSGKKLLILAIENKDKITVKLL